MSIFSAFTQHNMQYHCLTLLNSTVANTSSATVHTCTAVRIRRMQCTTGTTQALHATTGHALSRLGLFLPNKELETRNRPTHRQKWRRIHDRINIQMQTIKAPHTRTTGTVGGGCSCDASANTQKQTEDERSFPHSAVTGQDLDLLHWGTSFQIVRQLHQHHELQSAAWS
jgi:hypothetical protein